VEMDRALVLTQVCLAYGLLSRRSLREVLPPTLRSLQLGLGAYPEMSAQEGRGHMYFTVIHMQVEATLHIHYDGASYGAMTSICLHRHRDRSRCLQLPSTLAGR
jgi:hypothetical protein